MDDNLTAFSLSLDIREPFKAAEAVILMTRGDMVTGKALL